MLRGGTVIRLIDVVLIILLGFLGITDFEIKSQIKLPSAVDSGQKEIKQQFIFLDIKSDNRFDVINGQNTIKQVEGIEALEKFLIQLNKYYLQHYKQMILVIEPNLETMIQTTVDVMDICEKHQILKNLSYSQVELD
ncbi:MAG: biopolymer transporter ExbD [bacterium]|nr:MAG: biopolymer transporter ExbD [bacterium]